MKNQKQSLTPAKVLSARKFVFTGRYFMEELHGCVRRERSAFLSCFSSRPSQPSWTSASPVGHPRFSVLRHTVRRQELRGNRSMGARSDITLMHRLGFTRRPPEGGRDPQGLDRPECQGIRARFDPMGRDVVEPPDNRQAVTAGGLLSRQPSIEG